MYVISLNRADLKNYTHYVLVFENVVAFWWSYAVNT